MGNIIILAVLGALTVVLRAGLQCNNVARCGAVHAACGAVSLGYSSFANHAANSGSRRLTRHTKASWRRWLKQCRFL